MLNINTDLIKRAQQGDLKIISALYEQYQRSIFCYLYYRVGDQQTAEDGRELGPSLLLSFRILLL